MHSVLSTDGPAPLVGPDSGTAERQCQQLVWDSSERSGQRSEEDLHCCKEKERYGKQTDLIQVFRQIFQMSTWTGEL